MTSIHASSQVSNRKRQGAKESSRHLSLFGIFISACLGAGIYILGVSLWMDENTASSNSSTESKFKKGLPSAAKSKQPFMLRQILTAVVERNGFKQSVADSDVRDLNRTIFPSPLEKIHGGQVTMKPIFGTHRPDVDAVFSFAQGYSLRDYVRFIETLAKTGFDGDIVISVASVDKLDPSTLTYLKSKQNVIVYAVSWQCFKRHGEPMENPDDYALCQIKNFLGLNNGTGIATIEDIRIPRPLATARFELFWAWSLQYNPLSLLLLIDFRDVFFQLHPFIGIKRSLPGSKDGVLYFYEERRVESF
jgi:hypothetical protein